MMNKKTKFSVSFCAKNNLCTGCGICMDTCFNNAISIQKVGNLNKPVIDLTKCKNEKGCSRCYDVCPGKGGLLKGQNKTLFSENDSLYDETIGFYQGCFVGHSCDESIRFHSASGGCTTAFLIYLLDKGYIDGAVVTRFSMEDPFKAEPFIATTKEEIISAKSSKYCPVSMNGMASLVKSFMGKVAIVGLPCHIQGFRNLATLDKLFAGKVFAYIGLFCSASKDYQAIDRICKEYRIDKAKVVNFTYRDDGCLGFLKAEYADGSVVKASFEDYYGQLHSFYKPERCISCIDHFAKLADISFGDIHVLPYSKDKVGSNSIVVRSKKMNGVLKQALKDGSIFIQDIFPSEIARSQGILSYRGKIFIGHRFIERLLRRPVAEYDDYPILKVGMKPLMMDLFYRLQRLCRWFR